jgi:hypothetical protein
MASGGKRSTTWKPGTNPKMKKGTKRKATLLKEAFGVKTWEELKGFVEGPGLERLIAKMARLRPAQYATVFLSLTEFIKPKLQRTTIAGDPTSPIKTSMTINIVKSDVPIAESEEEIR